MTKFNSKYDPKGCGADVCFLWTFRIPQCKINMFLLWIGTELIPLTAPWSDLNDFYRNLTF